MLNATVHKGIINLVGKTASECQHDVFNILSLQNHQAYLTINSKNIKIVQYSMELLIRRSVELDTFNKGAV